MCADYDGGANDQFSRRNSHALPTLAGFAITAPSQPASHGTPVIRFKCPHCSRQYELPAVLARMALLCKGCGQSISAPKDAVDEPEPQFEVKLPPPPVAPPKK